jgi:hypothetical protein
VDFLCAILCLVCSSVIISEFIILQINTLLGNFFGDIFCGKKRRLLIYYSSPYHCDNLASVLSDFSFELL